MWHTGSMRVVIFLCCLHLVVVQAKALSVGFRVKAMVLSPRPPRTGIRHTRSSGSEDAVKTVGFRTMADFKPPSGIRHSRSSGSESAVKYPNHVPEFLSFSKNAEGVPQRSIENIWDSLGKPTIQPATVVKQSKLPNLDGLTMEQMRQNYGPAGSKPQPKARNPAPGMDKHHVFLGLPRSPVGNRVAKGEH